MNTEETIIYNTLVAIGEDPSRKGLVDTPRRVVKSWKELYGGYKVDIEKLFTVFEEGHDELVVLRDVEFHSNCEHHMVPFFGRAHIGYVPDKGRVVGVSKLARVVEAFARRLQIQERLGQQIAEAIMKYLKPQGCGVILEAQHLCMLSRGVGKQNSVMVTSSLRGAFTDDQKLRAEFLDMIRKR